MDVFYHIQCTLARVFILLLTLLDAKFRLRKKNMWYNCNVSYFSRVLKDEQAKKKSGGVTEIEKVQIQKT